MIGRLFRAQSDDGSGGGWFSPFGSGSSASYGPVNKSIVSSSPWFRAFDLLSNSVGMMPLLTYKRTGQSDNDREIAADHPVYALLHRRPNPYTSSFRFIKLMMFWKVAWGNGYAEIERRRGDKAPVALWPIHPSRVNPEIDDNGHITWIIHNNNGSTTEIADENMLHTMGLSDDGVRGLSMIGLARRSAGLTVSAEEYGYRFFKNDARPGVVLEHPKTLTDAAREKLKKSWIENYSGDKIGSPAVLQEGMKASTFTMPNTDSQFLETRRFQVLEVARWTGVPAHKLQELEQSTNNNIEHQAMEYSTDGVMPHAVDIEQECERKLFTVADQSSYIVEFLAEGLLRADIETRQKAFAIQRQWGIINARQWAKKENLPPLPAEVADTYLWPVNYAPADRILDGSIQPTSGKSERVPSDQVALAADAIITAHRGMAETAFDRMVRVECTALRRAAKRGESGCEFYGEFEPKLVNAVWAAADSLDKCLTAIGASLKCDVAKAVKSYVSDYCERSAVECGNSGNIVELANQWETDRAAREADNFIDTLLARKKKEVA